MAFEGQPSRVTVVVVSFNTCEVLRKCLSSIEPEHEVIVVDNASTDGSAEMIRAEFPHANLIVNADNRGFGEANNQGIRAATRPLILLLNSDAYAKPGSIQRLALAFDDPEVVAVGGRLLNPDGTLQNSSAKALTLWAVFCEQTMLERLLPLLGLPSPYWNSDIFRQTGETEQVMGACLMLRPVELFDERFFLYCEDTELCRRLRRHGKILYVPEAEFTHDLGTSSVATRWMSVARYNFGKELYFKIHFGEWTSFLCLIIDRAGAKLRMLFWLVVQIISFGQMGRGKVLLFWNVMMAPWKGPKDPRQER